MAQSKSRPTCAYLLAALVLFQALSGMLGGIGLIADPSGKSMQIPLKWLEGSPFANYLFPGLILFLILGVFPLVVFIGLVRKTRWAWYGTMLLAVALLIWIGVEILIIGYQANPPLQLIYGLVGVILLILVLIPEVRRFYDR